MKTDFLLFLNKFFIKPKHPFNLQNENVKTYAEWQYEKGEKTIEFYLEKYSKEEMFKDKNVLDVGCGAGGKSLYYASLGAEKVTGIDILPKYGEECRTLAEKLGMQSRFEFVCADASELPFENEKFDTIIMNDAMEHVENPVRVLHECRRVLKPDGKIFINFPPYMHPYGAHLSDAIGIPWVHLFFGEQTLIDAYKRLVKNLPDGEERINFRISRKPNDMEYFSYINKMSINRFKKIIQDYKVVHYKEAVLRRCLAPLKSLPIFKEMFTKMVVCVIEK